MHFLKILQLPIVAHNVSDTYMLDTPTTTLLPLISGCQLPWPACGSLPRHSTVSVTSRRRKICPGSL